MLKIISPFCLFTTRKFALIFSVRDTFCSYGVMELNVRDLATQIMQLKDRGIQLSCVRTCVVVAEERPRVGLCSAFSKLFSPLGLSPRAVSTSFGCRVNVAICMQVYVNRFFVRSEKTFLVKKFFFSRVLLVQILLQYTLI